MIPVHFVRAFEILKTAYRRWYDDQSAESLVMFATLLSDIPAMDLERTVIQFARSSKWPPTIAELLDLWRGGEVAAPIAWERVCSDANLTVAESRAADIAGGREAIKRIVARDEHGPPAAPRRWTAQDEAQCYRRFVSAFEAIVAEQNLQRERERSGKLFDALSGTRRPQLPESPSSE